MSVPWPCEDSLGRWMVSTQSILKTENIVIDFDDSKVTEQYLLKISKESIEKLGYRIND